MNLFCDAEFNSQAGALISLGLITEDGTREFYEVVECNEPLDPWVAQNVMTVLNKEPISMALLQQRLAKFLGQFAGVNVIVNHPNDVVYFSIALMKEKGEWIMVQPLSFEVDDDLSAKGSAILHNALEDAKATRDSWFKKHGYS